MTTSHTKIELVVFNMKTLEMLLNMSLLKLHVCLMHTCDSLSHRKLMSRYDIKGEK